MFCERVAQSWHSKLWRNKRGRARFSERQAAVAIVKVIEVLAESDKGWEDAAQRAVTEAAKSVRGIRSVYVKEMQAMVEGDHIRQYRVNAKISFVLESKKP
jgi:flavin-binding protein dodecin